ncbi:MAG: biotin--[acetyl-CoA-carboxylase] ligase [Anaerovoracaceae bacterium]
MLKQNVLKKLEEGKGTPISGASLADDFEVSRTAIWKCINVLKEEGYPIETFGKKGYILSKASDILSKSGIEANLKNNIPINVYDSVTSTNTVAADLALKGFTNFTAVIANEQTKGKGRLGRSFYSPSAKGIYMSLIIKPTFDISKSTLITTAASVAVANSIHEVTGLDPKIKWVNDIFLDGKKVCGILTEAISDFETGTISHIILGIGINCHQSDFPDDIKDIAGYLGGNFDRNVLTAKILDNLLDQLSDLDSKNFIDEYKKRSLVLDQEIVVYKSGIKENSYGVNATAIDITNSGGLVVRYHNGQKDVLTSGEISISIA